LIAGLYDAQGFMGTAPYPNSAQAALPGDYLTIHKASPLFIAAVLEPRAILDAIA
jgi:hypothetical protein